jgi:hypothetical protein
MTAKYPQRQRRLLAPRARQAAARAVIAANKANGVDPDPRIVAVAEGKIEDNRAHPEHRRSRPIEVRQAAARMVIAANTAKGKKTDPRIVAVAEGKNFNNER